MLFEARKRYGLSILNYAVTSNHLIVTDNGKRGAIPKSMQYITGRVGQEYNRRKNRKGAFWQDRYHATAIESGDHLWQCLVYVDLITQSVAVGSEAFIAGVHKALGVRAKGRNIASAPDGAYQLRESMFEYGTSSCELDAAYIENHDGGNQIPWSISRP